MKKQQNCGRQKVKNWKKCEKPTFIYIRQWDFHMHYNFLLSGYTLPFHSMFYKSPDCHK